MKIYQMIIFGLLLLAIAPLTGCGQQNTGISAEDVWARPGLADGNSAVFFIIHNDGTGEEKLVSASSDVADAVELHKSTMVDGAMKMEMQDFILVQAGGEMVFKPGDYHVMLIGLKDDLSVGDEFEVTLGFESGEAITISVVVREP